MMLVTLVLLVDISLQSLAYSITEVVFLDQIRKRL